MQAVILAAGMGKRLKELTKDNTKCMVKVNGETLIARMLRQLGRHDLSRIVIVVGYKKQALIDYIDSLDTDLPPIVYIDNPIYDKTNNIYSLSLAKEYLCAEDTLLFESDLIFEDSVLDLIVNDPYENIALVDKYESWMDGTCLTLDDQNHIVSFISGDSLSYEDRDEYYKTVNIYKFSKNFSKTYFFPFLEAYLSALGENEYYEQVLKVIAMVNSPVIEARRLSGQLWYEIDDIQDLDIAESIFIHNDEEKLELFQKRYGGYWRYPKLLDYCYLVNPYFPPQQMIDEMRASFDTLLTEYPSGMRVNQLLASKFFNVRPENILVGNGAAELIKVLMDGLQGYTGLIRSSFEEYPNRTDPERSVCFYPEGPDFSYGTDDIISFFDDKNIQNLVVINPDNPSGNYIPHKDIIRLIEWSMNKGITLIVDESFSDFSDEVVNTLLSQDILNNNPCLFVVKSISKSFGVPGLRLGVIASGDIAAMSTVYRRLPIWNINSFAEFYMQIAEKYKDYYAQGLEMLRAERSRFASELSRIDGIRVIPSQANYIMIELMNGVSSRGLAKKLLSGHSIFVKDLSSKISTGNYLRLSVRNTADNDRLLSALRSELEK